MTNMVKRFVALTAAGLLFVSAAFTSLAEEITEGDILPAETEEMTTPEVMASEITETSETIPEPVYQEPEAAEEASPAPESEPETVPQEAEPVKQEADTAKETSPVTESKPEKEEADDDGDTETFDDEDDDYDFIFDDFDQGSVDADLTEIYFPNGGGPTAETGESTEQTEGTEEAGNIAAPRATALRIVPESGRAIRVGEQAVLNAEAETEIVGDITWEMLNETPEEDIWETIGLGRQLLLDVTEEILNRQIRFVLEDGSASEIYVLTEMEAQEEPEQEEEAQTTEEQGEEKPAETAAETEEQTEVQNGEETAEILAESEITTSEAVIEEPVEEPIRVWIAAETENNAVNLTAEADVELDESIVWQMKAADDAEWKNIWYGKTASIEMTEENADSVIRFRTSDGVFSEEFRLTVQEAEVEETEIEEPEGEEEETETEETGIDKQENEEPESKEDEEQPVEEAFALPEGRSVTFTITGDGEALRLGDVAHFNAELTGYEGLDYTLQWQMSTDNENWEDIPDANEPQMDLVMTEENSRLFWRVTVMIHMPKSVETQPDEVPADDGVPAEEALPDEGQTSETQSDETQPNEMQINDAQNDEGSED